MEQPTSQPDRSNAPVFSTGELEFRVQTKDGVVEHKIDLLSLKLTCEECEAAHGLQAVDGRLQPTAAFLSDLAGRCESLGVCGCTGTVAWQLWLASANAMEQLKNALSGMPS
jgi:hypothetical protein